MSELSGRTVIITGGSRGIGQAIGMRFAKAGANIVILAKQEHSTDTLDDIHSAAAQMKAAKGSIMALDVDVRDADMVKSAVEKAVNQFGGIDVLINNVSAFCFTDTVNTMPEKFDLLYSVNVRATFLLSKLCYPYLKNAMNPHIINISPPLDMHSRWFKHHLAFTMSKYGMSMCTLGMADEFKKAGIGVNSLWPRTTIATTTIKECFASEVYAGSRWPEIMADAAYEIVRKPAKKCTGQFFIDEAMLREAGVTEFSRYAVDPDSPLVQDLFVSDGATLKDNNSIPLEKDFFIS